MILRINNDIEIELISNYEAQSGVLNFVRGSSKVKTIAPVDVEKLNSIKEFVDYACTENRMKQAVEQVFYSNSEEPKMELVGNFLKWIMSDIVKEELDTLNASNIEVKQIAGAVNKKAVAWFKENLVSL